jgi:hypothetical protein
MYNDSSSDFFRLFSLAKPFFFTCRGIDRNGIVY